MKPDETIPNFIRWGNSWYPDLPVYHDPYFRNLTPPRIGNPKRSVSSIDGYREPEVRLLR